VIKKRLVGVVTVLDGWAVQSFGYGRYLPLGRPEIHVENLDRWGADEILLNCIDRSRRNLGPDMTLLDRIGRKGLSTPLIYSGGIRHAQDAVDAVNAAADRIAVDALIRDDLDEVARAGARLGNQAVIGSIPLSIEQGEPRWLNYRTGAGEVPSTTLVEALQSGLLSEALVIDWTHEGHPSAFDLALLDILPQDVPIIAFGGISEAGQIAAIMKRPNVVGAAVGNALSYREHAVQALRQALPGAPIRPASYQQAVYA